MSWDYIKTLFSVQEDLTEKEIAVEVNGIINRLSPKSQSELIYQLMKHRESSIEKVSTYLKGIEEDKHNLRIKIQDLDLIT